MENTIILSSDELRKDLFGDINDQSHNGEVFSVLHKKIKENIKAKNIIIDATNITVKSRKALLDCVNNNCKKTAIIMTSPIEMCKKRNSNRGRVVPEFVIDRQAQKFQIPFYEEGFDEIIFDNWTNSQISGFKTGWNLKDDIIFKITKGFNQENSHHKYTLDEHCYRTAIELCKPEWDLWNNRPFIRAATIHDIGKIYTKKEKENKPGEYSYYSHHNIGAYKILTNIDLLGFNNYKDILECLFYINYHMEPFFWNTLNSNGDKYILEKTKEKMKKRYGEEKFFNLLCFNIADRLASGNEPEANIEKSEILKQKRTDKFDLFI